MADTRGTGGGLITARMKYEELERRILENDGNLTAEDFRHLIFLDYVETNNHLASVVTINGLKQIMNEEDRRKVSWYTILTEFMRLSYENTKNAIHIAFTAMVSLQQDLKEISAIYRNIKTEEQAKAYSVLYGIGLKRYLPDFDTDASGFSFNRHTATMVLNIFGTMTRIQHYNAMIRIMAEWSGVKRLNEAKLPDLKKQIEELNTLTHGVLDDVENCPLLEKDKADANATYEKWYKLFDMSLFKTDRGFKKRLIDILDGCRLSDVLDNKGQLEIASATSDMRDTMDEERYFSKY